MMKYVSVIIVMFMGYGPASSQPRIHIEGNDVYDWGTIDPKGKPLTASVRIFNQGTDTLRISEVKPGCGCTTAPLDKSNIEPYGYATLSVSLTVSTDGPITKGINIQSNDPTSPQKNLSLRADIVRPISLSSRMLMFSNMELGKESTSTVVIRNNTERPIRIKDIVTDPKTLVTNVKKHTRILAKKEFTLEARYTPSNASTLSGRVTLMTDNTEMETIEISVLGSISPTRNK